MLAVCRRVRWAEKGLDRPATEREISSEAEPPETPLFWAGLTGARRRERCAEVGQIRSAARDQAGRRRAERSPGTEGAGRRETQIGRTGRQGWRRWKAPERRPRQRRPEIPAWIWRRHRPAAQAKGKTTARARAALRNDRRLPRPKAVEAAGATT